MNQDQFNEFAELWQAVQEMMAAGKHLSTPAMRMVFNDLSGYPIELIEIALETYRKSNKFAPTAFDIIELLDSKNGNKHMGIEEAWAKASLMMSDEDSSFIVTKEIMEAFGIAESLYLSGDKFSAARAFKEKYAALIKTASSPVWFVTMGNDKQRRIEAISEARKLNLLTNHHAHDLMLGLDKPLVTVDALLENHAKKTSADNAKANLAGLKLIIDNTKPEKSHTEITKEHESLLREQHHQKLAQLKDLYPDEVNRDIGEEDVMRTEVKK